MSSRRKSYKGQKKPESSQFSKALGDSRLLSAGSISFLEENDYSSSYASIIPLRGAKAHKVDDYLRKVADAPGAETESKNHFVRDISPSEFDSTLKVPKKPKSDSTNPPKSNESSLSTLNTQQLKSQLQQCRSDLMSLVDYTNDTESFEYDNAGDYRQSTMVKDASSELFISNISPIKKQSDESNLRREDAFVIRPNGTLSACVGNPEEETDYGTKKMVLPNDKLVLYRIKPLRVLNENWEDSEAIVRILSGSNLQVKLGDEFKRLGKDQINLKVLKGSQFVLRNMSRSDWAVVLRCSKIN